MQGSNKKLTNRANTLFKLEQNLFKLRVNPRLLTVAQQGGSVPKTLKMTSRQAKLQEDTNYRVMWLLEENPDLT